MPFPSPKVPVPPTIILYVKLLSLNILLYKENKGGGELPWCSAVKNPPAMRETQVQILGQENPLEKEKATHSRILAWRIPWTEEPRGLHPTGSQRVGHD